MAAKRTRQSGVQYQIATIGPIAYAVAAVLFILICWKALSIPLVTVCLFVVLEAVLAWLLNETPVYVPAAVAVVQIVAGLLRGKVVFMILMALLYVCAWVILQARMDYEEQALKRKRRSHES